MDQNSENSNIEKKLKEAKRPNFKSLSSKYCEIITTNHTQKSPTREKEEEEEKKTGVLSKTKGFFEFDDNPESFSDQEYQFRFDDLPLDYLKTAMKSIIKGVLDLEKDESDIKKLQEFLNNLSDHQTEGDVHKLVLQFYITFGKLTDPFLLTRKLNKAFRDQEKLPENCADLIVLKSFHSALAKLPIYCGECVRAIDLNKEERDIYQKESVINWRFFNSSFKGKQLVPPFDQRNTYFYIKSLTGRDIPGEGEVLLPPGCNFLIEDKTVQGDRTIITLKQVEGKFTDNIVLWVSDQISNQERNFLSKLYEQRNKYHLWLVEKPDLKIEEKLAEYIIQSQSFQIIIKAKFLQEETDNELERILGQKGKSCHRYCLKEKEEDVDIAKSRGYEIVESYKNLMEDLQARFIYKEQQLFNNEDETGLNDEENENSNYPSDDFDFNFPSLTNEASDQYEQNTTNQPSTDQQQIQSTGNMNTMISSEQTGNLPEKHCYLESTSQFK